MVIFIFMETKYTHKASLTLLILFICIFKNVTASTITGYELENLVEEWLTKNGSQANIKILPNLKYPVCDSSDIIMNDISGNFKLIKVSCIGKNPWQFIVRNKLNQKKDKFKKKEKISEYFALKNYKEKGAIISDKDLIIIKKKNNVRNVFISNKSDIIGKKLKKNHQSNQVLKYSNLENDWLIEKNSLVTIVNNKNFITIKEEGIALEDANFMDKLRVKNIKSGKIIVGYAKNQKKVILNTKQN